MWINPNVPPARLLLKIHGLHFYSTAGLQLCRPKALGHFIWTLLYHRLLHFLQNRTLSEFSFHLSDGHALTWELKKKTPKQLKRYSQIISDEWQHQPTQKCKNHQGLYQTESSPRSQASTTFWDNLQFLWPHCILPKTQDKRKYTPEDEDVGATAASLKPRHWEEKNTTISI